MTSWPDTVSQHAQDDLDGLLGSALGFAQQQLDEHGEFYPYAVVVDASGMQRMAAVDAGIDQPGPSGLIGALIAALAEERDQLRGAAIVADVRVRELGSDAIRVNLEHSENVALTILLPYRPRRFGRGIAYGDLQAGPAAAFLWPAD